MTRLSTMSKTLSYWLRHKPSDILLNMDNDGYVSITELIDKAKDKITITYNDIKYVVENDNKNRFSFKNDMSKIRANQGHSNNLDIDLGLEEVLNPPIYLYHGTPTDVLDSIKAKGLIKMSRQHVHLSKDIETAEIVAKRRKREYIILRIEAKEMAKDNIKLYKSQNGVYLVDSVPSKYIKYEYE